MRCITVLVADPAPAAQKVIALPIDRDTTLVGLVGTTGAFVVSTDPNIDQPSFSAPVADSISETEIGSSAWNLNAPALAFDLPTGSTLFIACASQASVQLYFEDIVS